MIGFDEITSRQKHEKLGRLLHERRRRSADASLYYFCKYILGYKDMRLQPHWEMCDFIQRNGYKYDTLSLCPRGTFKSTVITVGYPLWMLTKDRNLRICIDSFKLANSKGWLAVIARHIESNEVFRRTYGDWKGEPWTSTHIALSGRTRMVAEFSVVASSYETPKTGQHYDMVFEDDLQTGENITSKEMIDATEEHTRLFIPILDPQDALRGARGPRLFVGTRWHDDDIYGRMIAQEKKKRIKHGPGKPTGLQMYVRAAAEKHTYVDGKFKLGGKLYFPERFTEEYLDEIQETVTSFLFSCQWLNDPLPEGMAIFKLSRFGWWNSQGMRLPGGDIRPLPSTLNIFATVDPSVGENADSDYSAIVVNGMDSNYNWLIQHVTRAHLDPDELLEKFFEIQEKWKPYRFGLETVIFQKVFLYAFEAACRRRGVWFPIEQLRTDTRVSKELRISGMQPYFNAGKVFFPVDENIPLTSPLDVLYHSVPEGVDMLLDELVRFPRAATRDCADALAYMPQLVFPASVALAPSGPAKGSFQRVLDRLIKTKENLLQAGIRSGS